MKKEWNLKGNQALLSVKNPLRHLCEKIIPQINKELQQKIDQSRPKEFINLSIGDPVIYQDFKTNPKLLEIAQKGVGVIDGYTDFQGAFEARQAVANHYTNLYKNKVNPDDVFLTTGGSLALWLSLNVLAGPGDNFLFPEAQFPLLMTMAKSIGVEPRIFPLLRNQNWEIDFEELQKKVDKNTKFILLNDPSNPLGVTWSVEHKKKIVQFCKKHNLIIVADQIYETMTFKESQPCFPQLRETVPVFKCSGLTKKWLVPGWRIGWLVLYGGEQLTLIKRSLKNLMNIVLMPTTIITAVLPQIFNQQTNAPYLKQRMQLLGKNAEALRNGLSSESYCTVSDSNGALYSVIDIKMQELDIEDTEKFIISFYKQQNVLTFPGQYFASKFFIRLVICCSLAQIQEFCVRFKRFCHKHKNSKK